MSFSVSQLKHHLISMSGIIINQEKIKVTVSIPHIGHILDMVPSGPVILARCVDVFVEDLFISPFLSFISK